MTLTRDEVLEIIRAEGLGGYRWFEDATNKTDIVAIERTPGGWAVFATDERATPVGRREFASEGAALENFLTRLRAGHRLAAWQDRSRQRHPADTAAPEGRRPVHQPGGIASPDRTTTAAGELSSQPSARYFIREHRIDGQFVPVRMFRRRTDASGTTDEFLADVDTWVPDTRGVLDRAVRFSLDSDLEEISEGAAGDVMDMVAKRTYVPLRRR